MAGDSEAAFIEVFNDAQYGFSGIGKLSPISVGGLDQLFTPCISYSLQSPAVNRSKTQDASLVMFNQLHRRKVSIRLQNLLLGYKLRLILWHGMLSYGFQKLR